MKIEEAVTNNKVASSLAIWTFLSFSLSSYLFIFLGGMGKWESRKVAKAKMRACLFVLVYITLFIPLKTKDTTVDTTEIEEK